MTNNTKNTTTNNANASVNTNAQAQVPAREKSLKCLANDAAKAEMFSPKQALTAVRNAYQADTKGVDTRKYLRELGFSSQILNRLAWTELAIKVSGKGRASTWGVLNALRVYSEEHDLTGEKAAKAAAKEEREKAKAAKARIQARKEAEKAAKAAKSAK